MKCRLSYCLLVLLVSGVGGSTVADVLYRNPSACNVEYRVELYPEPNEIDSSTDLKLWIPVPREWASQKAVQITSVEPEPHAEYTDPEHGNRMLFWDFGAESSRSCYDVTVRYRIESYEVHAEIDPNAIVSYDKSSKEYRLYTRSTHTITITPEIRELARQAVGGETNPYVQARRIFEFVRRKMRLNILDAERGRGISCLLAHPVRDEETGEQHYEGSCSQYSAFFCALCRAVGIPARTVFAFRSIRPWTEGQPLRPLYRFETKLSPEGRAGVQHMGSMYPHMWAEFLLPGYGWIPADAQMGRFGSLDNKKVVLNKGRDVLIGPHAPQEQHGGYGSQWVSLHKGRADYFFSAIWNISKIHTAKAAALHTVDPFPADALARYAADLYPEAEAHLKGEQFRKQILAAVDEETRGQTDRNAAFRKACNEDPRFWYSLEPFVCHMLREAVGAEIFADIYANYLDRRVDSKRPVSIERFRKIADEAYGKPLDWFWSQWLERREPAQLKLHDVCVSKVADGWRVGGSLSQVSRSTFRLPVEMELQTERGTQRKRIWLAERDTTFQFDASSRPQRVLVDPDYDILAIRTMPPFLNRFWSAWPNYVVVYGTTKEAEANRSAAERFSEDCLGLGRKVLRADTDVNDADLKDKCVFLFGRPETNRIAQQFERAFPIRFEDGEFLAEGKTYHGPTCGVAQVVEDPDHSARLVILFAGLGGEAMSSLADLGAYDAEASYVIFDGDEELTRGDWPADENLVWTLQEDEHRQTDP